MNTNMKTIKLFAIALMALAIVSCSKTKEEQFIDDYEELVEKFENSSFDVLNSSGEQILNTFKSKMISTYGIDLDESYEMIDCVKSSDLKLNDDQKKKVIDLQERFNERIAELRKEADGNHEKEDDEIVQLEEIEEVVSESVDEEEINDLSSNSDSDSEDWDALLRSYEEYVDKYISCLKKAKNGDMSALTEYTSLFEKAQEFTEKMQNAQNNMSASQWARYNKITMKMMKAAQEMQ